MKYANVFKIEFDFPEQKSVARIHLRAQRAPLGFFQGMGEMEVRSRARHLLRTLLTCQRGIKGWLCVHWVWWVCKGGDFSGGCGQLTALRSGAEPGAADVWPTHWAGSANRPPFIAQTSRAEA